MFHSRDSTDLEADAIVERRDGTWAAFEVKLGPAAVDEAAETLRRVAARVDPERHGKPAVLGVITGWGYGYRRPDGVAVIPIAQPREVVDPTGAGDAYAAGFVHGLTRGFPLAQCGRIAALAAVYVIECYGTQAHTFSRDDFAARYAENFGATLSL